MPQFVARDPRLKGSADLRMRPSFEACSHGKSELDQESFPVCQGSGGVNGRPELLMRPGHIGILLGDLMEM